MGYTMYFKVGGKVSDSKWNEFTERVKQIINVSGVDIRDGVGDGDPVINDKRISLNGDDEKGQAHEPFEIIRGSDDSDFCKTAMKPYDCVVVASLMEGKRLGIIDSWSSDGDDESGDFDEAKAILNKLNSENEPSTL